MSNFEKCSLHLEIFKSEYFVSVYPGGSISSVEEDDVVSQVGAYIQNKVFE